MKYNNESFEEWSKKVDMFERGYAMQRIANGEPAELVIEQMSKRIIEKLMHPIFKNVQGQGPSQEDIEAGRKRYEEIMKTVGLKPDHVLDENIDTPE